MKLRRWHKDHKARAALKIFAEQPAHPIWSLCKRPNFRSTYHTHCPFSTVCLYIFLNVIFKYSSFFQQGEGPSCPNRGLLCDYTTLNIAKVRFKPWYKEPICVRTLYFSPSPSARTGAIMESELSSISYSGMSAGLISMQRQTVTINVQVFKETNLIHDDHQCFQLIIQWMNAETLIF